MCVQPMLRVFAFSLLMANSAAALSGAPESDFLEGAPTMTPVPGVVGAYGWNNPDLSLIQYDKLFLDDIQIFLAKDSPYKGIDASQMAALTATMRAVLTEKLEPDFPLVSRTGPRVMRISLAITNVKISKRKKRLINYTPVGLVVGGLRRLTDAFANLSLEEAYVEAEFTDTQSGERIAVRIATNPFAQSNIGEGELSWDALEAAFGFYASEIRKTLDAAHAGK